MNYFKKNFFVLMVNILFIVVSCVNDQATKSDDNKKITEVKEVESKLKDEKPKPKPKDEKQSSKPIDEEQKPKPNQSQNQSSKKQTPKKERTNQAQKNNNTSSKPKQQASKKPSYKKIVANTNKAEQERLKAIQQFNKSVDDKADYDLLKKIVQTENEPIKLRQEALKKIYKPCGKDEEMLEYMFGVLKGKDDVFKKDILYALQTMKYSSVPLQKKQSQFLNALKTGLYNTTDKKIYYTLLKSLADANDPAAHEMIIDQLKEEDFSKLSFKQMLPILQKNLRPKHYASLHQIMQKTKKTDIKTKLIPLLIEHPSSKAQIIQYLGNPSTDIKVRLACAEILMEKDAPSFYTYTKNIISNYEDNIKLRRKSLELIIDADKETHNKYVTLKDDLLSLGISDTKLNQLREALLKKLD